jgi:hypothetical protein
MSSDATLYLFDFARHQSEIVPGIRRLLLDGEMDDWLAEIAQREGMMFREAGGVDLLAHCTYLNPTLGWDGVPEGDVERAELAPWEQRACESTTCYDRDNCPWHLERKSVFTWDVNLLVMLGVTGRCLGRGQFIGHNITLNLYRIPLDRRGVKRESRTWSLLQRLTLRGWVVGYAGQGAVTDLMGWLDPAETRELAELLESIDLPPLPPSFEDMDAARQGRLASFPRSVALDDLSLCFVRTVARIAADSGQGIAWRNE